MKGFYSPIDQLAAHLPRIKGTGAEFMTELSKRPGYKPQEAQDRELQTLMALPKMERAQFLAALKAKPAPKLNETVLTDNDNTYDDDNNAKYGEYTLPGGNNYREILLRMPHDEQRAKEFSDPASGHWDHANVLAHVRAKDRIGPNGEKILHLEEIQSDWHQKGRDKGYLPSDMPKQMAAAKLAYQRLKEQLEYAKSSSSAGERKLKGDMLLYQDPLIRQRVEASIAQDNNLIMDLMPQVMKAEAAYQDLEHKAKTGVPNAPFKKNWHELALKKMIHHAAANGYDSIAITPGAEQAKRYDLSKHINDLQYDPQTKTLTAWDHRGNKVINQSGVSEDQLPEYIGKEGSSKLLAKNQQDTSVKQLFDADLKVGGEGMKGFYDKIIPSFLNQFGKKYGAQVQPGSITEPGGEYVHFPGNFKADTTHAVHHFPITPEMREDVTKNGVPLYADGGEVQPAKRIARGGGVQPLLPIFKE